jgi:hypothetical protein
MNKNNHAFLLVRVTGALLLASAIAGGSIRPAVVLAQRSPASNSGQVYYPNPDKDWERRGPQEVGIDPNRLNEAIAFAISNESKAPRNLEMAHYQSFGREPFGEGIGPFKERGEPTGIILRHGYIVASA